LRNVIYTYVKQLLDARDDLEFRIGLTNSPMQLLDICKEGRYSFTIGNGIEILSNFSLKPQFMAQLNLFSL